MCHLKSRNGSHRHKEIKFLRGLSFNQGFNTFFPFFLFLVTAANTSWQKMFHLGSPANKRCVILRAGKVATVTKKQIFFRWLSFNQGFNSFFLFFFLKLHCYEKWEDYDSGWSCISLKAAFRLKVAALNFLNISLFILPVRVLVMQAALVLNSTY